VSVGQLDEHSVDVRDEEQKDAPEEFLPKAADGFLKTFMARAEWNHRASESGIKRKSKCSAPR